MEVFILILLLAAGFLSFGYMVAMALDGYVIGRWQVRMPAIMRTFWDWLHQPVQMGEVIPFPNQ